MATPLAEHSSRCYDYPGVKVTTLELDRLFRIGVVPQSQYAFKYNFSGRVCFDTSTPQGWNAYRALLKMRSTYTYSKIDSETA